MPAGCSADVRVRQPVRFVCRLLAMPLEERLSRLSVISTVRVRNSSGNTAVEHRVRPGEECESGRSPAREIPFGGRTTGSRRELASSHVSGESSGSFSGAGHQRQTVSWRRRSMNVASEPGVACSKARYSRTPSTCARSLSVTGNTSGLRRERDRASRPRECTLTERTDRGLEFDGPAHRDHPLVPAKEPTQKARVCGSAVHKTDLRGWVGADLNCRPPPCQGGVITSLDHQPSRSLVSVGCT